MYDNIICGIDVGSNTLKMAIGEIKDDNQIELVGLLEENSEGFSVGTVVNVEKAVESIIKINEKAEKMIGKHIPDVFVGISGGHIRNINSSGTIAIPNDRPINQDDVDLVLRHATTINIPPDLEILQIIPLSYKVNNNDGIKNPIGLSAEKLSVEVHIITGLINSVQNILNCFKKAGLNVINFIINPFAASISLLTEDEKNRGVIIIDIGDKTSNIVIYTHGGLKHIQLLALGGYHITKDISNVLKIHFTQAEHLKLKYGNAFVDEISDKDTIEVPLLNENETRLFYYKDFCNIINARVIEIFELLKKIVDDTKLINLIYGGIVLTGGASQMKGMIPVCESVFGLPARLGVPKIKNNSSFSVTPKFSSAIGLILYGYELILKENDDISFFDKIIEKMKSFISNFY
ncbi:MAG TPA: cell division protein FtsA [bacterium]|nr:cell division protein FtsA [bacterium]HOL46578.1 cell division protein FtsA [bacterium]HPQ17851.1 cell division protein FtsA [bacterium]